MTQTPQLSVVCFQLCRWLSTKISYCYNSNWTTGSCTKAKQKKKIQGKSNIWVSFLSFCHYESLDKTVLEEAISRDCLPVISHASLHDANQHSRNLSALFSCLVLGLVTPEYCFAGQSGVPGPLLKLIPPSFLNLLSSFLTQYRQKKKPGISSGKLDISGFFMIPLNSV